MPGWLRSSSLLYFLAFAINENPLLGRLDRAAGDDALDPQDAIGGPAAAQRRDFVDGMSTVWRTKQAQEWKNARRAKLTH